METEGSRSRRPWSACQRGRCGAAGAERGFARERDAPPRRARGDGTGLRLLREQLAGRAGARARDYLAGRGLDGEVGPHLPPRYAPPERYALRDYLAARDVPAELMVELNLLTTGDDIQGPFDRFRDPRDLPDPRRARPCGGLRRPRHEPGCQAEVPQLLRDAALPQGADALQPPRRRKSAHDTGRVIAVEATSMPSR